MGAALGRLDDRAARIVAWLGRNPVMAILAVALVAAALLIPGQAALPITDRDEARYALASEQMLASGNFIEPYNLDTPRLKKPAGIYWLQAGAAALTGQGADAPIWAYRLPSALGILAAALLTVWAFAPVTGTAAATVAGLIVASAVVTVIESHIAKTDAALLALIVLAQGALIRCLTRPSDRFGPAHALFWVGLAGGILVKGPIIVLVSGGTLLWMVAAERNLTPLGRIRAWPGLAILAVLVLPWFIAIAIVTKGGFFTQAVGQDLLGKVGTASEGHTGPPGYYLMTVWLTFWPWAVLALLALPWAWRNRKEPALRLIAGWVLPTWAVFAVVTTKLPHYTMPVLPAIGALAGMWLTREARAVPHGPVLRWAAVLLFGLGGLAVAALVAVPPVYYEGRIFPLALAAGLVGLILIVLAAWALAAQRLHAFAALAMASVLVMMPALLRVTAPGLDSLFLSPRLAAAHARFDACAERPLVISGYSELSLAILAGRDIVFARPEAAARKLSTNEPGWRAFVRLDAPDTAEKLSAMAGRPLAQVATVSGINYNKGGKTLTFGLFTQANDPVLAPCTAQG